MSMARVRLGPHSVAVAATHIARIAPAGQSAHDGAPDLFDIFGADGHDDDEASYVLELDSGAAFAVGSSVSIFEPTGCRRLGLPALLAPRLRELGIVELLELDEGLTFVLDPRLLAT